MNIEDIHEGEMVYIRMDAVDHMTFDDWGDWHQWMLNTVSVAGVKGVDAFGPFEVNEVNFDGNYDLTVTLLIPGDDLNRAPVDSGLDVLFVKPSMLTERPSVVKRKLVIVDPTFGVFD